jgi:catechol 2,3-dioxygenase-like lactoylglutathione lyase family enzyme
MTSQHYTQAVSTASRPARENPMPIRGLHHNAYRCRDSEENRKFYEDFLGLPLEHAFVIDVTKTGRATHVLHSFYRMGDGSYLAFFEVPGEEGRDFVFKDQHDFDLHIALEIPHADLAQWLEKAKATSISSRGPADHDMIQSIYFRDPNGYVIELTAKRPNHNAVMNPSENGARGILDKWQVEKRAWH